MSRDRLSPHPNLCPTPLIFSSTVEESRSQAVEEDSPHDLQGTTPLLSNEDDRDRQTAQLLLLVKGMSSRPRTVSVCDEQTRTEPLIMGSGAKRWRHYSVGPLWGSPDQWRHLAARQRTTSVRHPAARCAFCVIHT